MQKGSVIFHSANMPIFHFQGIINLTQFSVLILNLKDKSNSDTSIGTDAIDICSRALHFTSTHFCITLQNLLCSTTLINAALSNVVFFSCSVFLLHFPEPKEMFSLWSGPFIMHFKFRENLCRCYRKR